MSTACEINFDGLPGPTHNYAGLSWGNVASMDNAQHVSNPAAAAKQSVDKMRRMIELGFVQGVLPPHERPFMPLLRQLGFSGCDEHMFETGWRTAPSLMLALSSAAPMWTANAATVSPSPDTADGRVHFTIANMSATPHRAIEAVTTARILKTIFNDPYRFAHHGPLPSLFGDEGAANHSRLSACHGAPGVEFFVYGRSTFGGDADHGPKTFPARHSREASEAVARLHGLDPAHTVYARQTPALIDAGVFHNDVIAVGNGTILLHYENAFVETSAVIARLRQAMGEVDLTAIEVPTSAIPVDDVVKSYLFNSQLLTRRDGSSLLLLPEEVRETESALSYVQDLTNGCGPIAAAEFMDLRQSMRNGGGPACLRLRVTLTDDERAAVSCNTFMTEQRAQALTNWIDTYYRDRMSADDIRDPALLRESRSALDSLTTLLGLGSVYHFQGPAHV